MFLDHATANEFYQLKLKKAEIEKEYKNLNKKIQTLFTDNKERQVEMSEVKDGIGYELDRRWKNGKLDEDILVSILREKGLDHCIALKPIPIKELVETEHKIGNLSNEDMIKSRKPGYYELRINEKKTVT